MPLWILFSFGKTHALFDFGKRTRNWYWTLWIDQHLRSMTRLTWYDVSYDGSLHELRYWCLFWFLFHVIIGECHQISTICTCREHRESASTVKWESDWTPNWLCSDPEARNWAIVGSMSFWDKLANTSTCLYRCGLLQFMHGRFGS